MLPFRVKGPDGKLLDGVKKAFLKSAELTEEDYDRGYIERDSEQFFLQSNPHVEYFVKTKGKAPVIISFQVRDTGCFAVTKIDRTKEH